MKKRSRAELESRQTPGRYDDQRIYSASDVGSSAGGSDNDAAGGCAIDVFSVTVAPGPRPPPLHQPEQPHDKPAAAVLSPAAAAAAAETTAGAAAAAAVPPTSKPRKQRKGGPNTPYMGVHKVGPTAWVAQLHVGKHAIKGCGNLSLPRCDSPEEAAYIRNYACLMVYPDDPSKLIQLPARTRFTAPLLQQLRDKAVAVINRWVPHAAIPSEALAASLNATEPVTHRPGGAKKLGAAARRGSGAARR
eukprot:TRINITY_DN8319_c0_g3_i2.p1 TRINITY_DN8319_c0_g3~~TRINITY_DN8319_c0_g3_i2.p1  ORF type:complete len:247 (-),score=59.53 TRINITY_DN8319_c0_g3_i2:1077-1817(-)